MTHISIVVASGKVRPSPGDPTEVAHLIAKPFSARIVHDQLKAMLPKDRNRASRSVRPTMLVGSNSSRAPQAPLTST